MKQAWLSFQEAQTVGLFPALEVHWKLTGFVVLFETHYQISPSKTYPAT